MNDKLKQRTLTDSSLASLPGAQVASSKNPGGGGLFDNGDSAAEAAAATTTQQTDTPLGDEMSTVISLPILRALVQSWLQFYILRHPSC